MRQGLKSILYADHISFDTSGTVENESSTLSTHCRVLIVKDISANSIRLRIK